MIESTKPEINPKSLEVGYTTYEYHNELGDETG